MKSETVDARLPKDDKSRSKLAYKFDEVARLAKLDVETLESWEKEFPFLNAGRTGSGRKYFRRRDVDIILRIKELLSAKTLTMAGTRRRIEEEFGLIPVLPTNPEKLRKALYSVRNELQQIASSLEKRPKKGA